MSGSRTSMQTQSRDPNHKRLSVEDGYKTAHFTRIIKSLEFVFLIVNCLGFLPLSVQGLLQSEWLAAKLPLTSSYLIVVEGTPHGYSVSLEACMSYLRTRRTY